MTGDVTLQVRTRFGPMLVFSQDQFVSRSLELYGEYCAGEWKLLSQVVRPGMTVVEVGANIGAHTLALAKACKPGRLYAFEPQQRVFQVLCANLALNEIDNVMAYPEACGAVEGQAMVPPVDYGAPRNFGGVALKPPGVDRTGDPVRVVPLDSLALAACHLLKIDVEGFELQVLLGARQTIERCRPIIYVENDRRDQQGQIIDLIAACGYRLYWDTPCLFGADNFNGVVENIFGGMVSLNMFCVPRESTLVVAQMREIDPGNWTSPVPPC